MILPWSAQHGFHERRAGGRVLVHTRPEDRGPERGEGEISCRVKRDGLDDSCHPRTVTSSAPLPHASFLKRAEGHRYLLVGPATRWYTMRAPPTACGTLSDALTCP